MPERAEIEITDDGEPAEWPRVKEAAGLMPSPSLRETVEAMPPSPMARFREMGGAIRPMTVLGGARVTEEAGFVQRLLGGAGGGEGEEPTPAATAGGCEIHVSRREVLYERGQPIFTTGHVTDPAGDAGRHEVRVTPALPPGYRRASSRVVLSGDGTRLDFEFHDVLTSEGDGANA